MTGRKSNNISSAFNTELQTIAWAVSLEKLTYKPKHLPICYAVCDLSFASSQRRVLLSEFLHEEFRDALTRGRKVLE